MKLTKEERDDTEIEHSHTDNEGIQVQNRIGELDTTTTKRLHAQHERAF